MDIGGDIQTIDDLRKHVDAYMSALDRAIERHVSSTTITSFIDSDKLRKADFMSWNIEKLTFGKLQKRIVKIDLSDFTAVIELKLPHSYDVVVDFSISSKGRRTFLFFGPYDDNELTITERCSIPMIEIMKSPVSRVLKCPISVLEEFDDSFRLEDHCRKHFVNYIKLLKNSPESFDVEIEDGFPKNSDPELTITDTVRNRELRIYLNGTCVDGEIFNKYEGEQIAKTARGILNKRQREKHDRYRKEWLSVYQGDI